MAGCLALLSNSAFALAAVSRACRFDQIPASIQAPAASLFNFIGDAPAGAFDSLPSATIYEKRQHWILESLTLDWGSVQFYLFAENRIYWQDPLSSNRAWHLFRTMKSGGGTWWQSKLANEVLNDVSLDIFFHNRAFMYSARAGHPWIIEKLNDPSSFIYLVRGNHYYFDPKNRQQGFLAITETTVCNLTEWGLEAR